MGYIGQAPANKAVKTADIEDSAITAAKIADGTVVAGELASDSVTTAKILNANVTTAKLAADAIDSTKLADDAVGAEHIADNAVGLAALASGTDGNIISYDASGNPVAIATGSDGEVLTSAGAGQPPAFEAVSAGTALTGSTNNTIPTVTGANAISGEATLTYDGSQLESTGSAPVWKINSTAHSNFDMVSGTAHNGNINFGDSGDADIGKITYDHVNNFLTLTAGASTDFRLHAGDGGTLTLGNTNTEAQIQGGGHTVRGVCLREEQFSTFNNSVSGGPVIHLVAGYEDNLVNTVVKITRKGWALDAITSKYNETYYNTSSDYRLKENEIPLTDGIERVKQLKPYKFNFKECPVGDPDYEQVEGFFAHEVSPIIPTAIQGEKDAIDVYTDGDPIPEGKSIGDAKLDEEGNPIGKWQGIDHSKMIPLLTATIKDLITKVETLEAKVTVLENA